MKVENLVLVPAPRSISFEAGEYLSRPEQLISLQAPEPFRLLFSAKTLQSALQKSSGKLWPISAGSAVPQEEIGVVLRLSGDKGIPDQGYNLIITPTHITLEASTISGIFYGVCTLVQIAHQNNQALPCLTISDWPDYPVRSFMLDISRDKVPTMDTLLGLVDKLASWKINQLQLYTEHTFAYRKHSQVWEKASPMTGQEILELDAYCKERFIELVPNQNSFGHMHRWLIHPRYAPLAEVTEGFMTPWGYREGPFSLNPTDPASFELVSGLFDELLPHFSSRQVNIGCDETFDLGQGKSKAACEQFGRARVYLDFLEKISSNLMQRGYTVQFWGDIVLEHPEVIRELPKDIIALDWGYEETHLFELEASRFEQAGIAFYVCPGTSSWCSLGGRTQNALGNLLNAAKAGLNHGASGYMITDWGDLGHWQTLPVSYLGIVSGAALAWAVEANCNLDVVAALNIHAFEDDTATMGELAYELGNIYLLPGLARPNGSQLFWFLQYSFEQLSQLQQRTPGDTQLEVSRINPVPESSLLEALNRINQLMLRLEKSQMKLPEGELIKREYHLTARLMRLACWRGLLASGKLEFQDEYSLELPNLIEEYKQVWLNRNRPGGLEDSIAGFLKLA